MVIVVPTDGLYYNEQRKTVATATQMRFMEQEFFNTLSKTPLFAGIEPKDLSALLTCLNPRTRQYKKQETIALEGSSFEGIGCVLSGEVSILKENAAGDRVIMSILPPGSLFGEMAAFTANPAWPATAVASEACAVLFIPTDKLTGACGSACEWHTRLIGNMLRILSEKALALNRKLDYLLMKTMRGKLCAFLLDQCRRAGNATFLLPMNRNELADYLGVSRPSMSRELGRMRDEGLIDFHMATIRLLDQQKMKRMVE